MGAGQSSDKQQQAHKGDQGSKTSFYELLSVDKQATDDDIKKAYRRKALELHPDRNYGDVERTTKLFAEIQAAYEVLSDPQERAWYDSHEHAILNDVDVGASEGQYEHSIGITSAEDIAKLFRKFNGNVDFSDAPSGFFGFLRETFDTLAKEERTAASRDGSNIPDYPSFGHKDDKHEDVVKAFYNAWTSFATRKSFAWRDKYRTPEAADRRVRRLIEKENKRLRAEGVQEFNDAIRSLVAFVKKRDLRYKPNSQTEAERQQILRDAAKAQAARMRAANEAKLNDVVPEWTRARASEEEEEVEEEESEEEQFECVACRKTFKSEKQFEAHEKSKKHQKAVNTLRNKLRKEGLSLDLDEAPESSDSVVASQHRDSTDSVTIGSAQNFATQDNSACASDAESLAEKVDLDIQELEIASNTSSYSSSEAQPLGQNELSEGQTESSQIIPPSEVDQDQGQEATDSTPKAKKGKAAQKRAKKAAQEAAVEGDQKQKCATCGAAFPSRTRLFQHIKDFGHGAPLSKGKSTKRK